MNLLMFLSGAAALSYELVWLRMLSRAFGVTVHAVASLIALYMAGLALGAALAPRLLRGRDGLRVYAWLEVLAGAFALAATLWLVGLPERVASLGGNAPLSIFWRLVLAAPALLAPTILLGATLPALVAAAGSPGALYGSNTLGALAGLTFAGFWSIGEWGESATVAFAFACNAGAALGAFWLSGSRPARAAGERSGQATTRLLWLYGAAGFVSMGLEVLWSRTLVLILGNSTYAFSAVLASYLAGVGIGSRLAEKSRQPPSFAESLLATACLALLSAACFRLMGLQMSSPRYLYSPFQTAADLPLMAFQSMVLVFPTSLAMGMTFTAAARQAGAGAVGALYAANTVGGVAGSLATGFWGMRLLGSHGSFLALAVLQATIGALALGRFRGVKPWALAAAFAGVLLSVRRDPVPEIIERRLRGGRTLIAHVDSPEAAVTILERGPSRYLLINGIATSENSLPGVLMQLLPNIFIEKPQSALVICLGAGNTLRTASLLGGRIDGVELIPEVIRRLPEFHSDITRHLSSPRVAVHAEDGRHFLLRSRNLYDTIVVDAAPPLYSAGTVNLYTSEFMRLALAHLSEPGVFSLWLPTLSFEEDYGRILRSLSDTFPHVAVWQQPMSGLLFFGSRRPFAWPNGLLGSRLKQRTGPLGLRGADEAFARSGFKLREAEIRAYAARFPPVTDDWPNTEFPLRRFLTGNRLETDDSFLLRARR